MSVLNDLVGTRQGKLTVLRVLDIKEFPKRKGNSFYECKCDCGNMKIISRAALRHGQRSCGCSKNENISLALTTHGESRSKLYGVWLAMRRRCYHTNDKKYAIYGGRGIEVCDGWRYNYMQFREWSYSNGYKEGLTLDRINTDGNYEPSNCR